MTAQGPDAREAAPATDGKGLASIGVATAFVAAVGLFVLWVAFRSLGPAGYAEFSVFWGFLFGVLGALSGLQQESTRAVGATSAGRPADGVAVLIPSIAIGGALALILLVTSTWWGEMVFEDRAPELAALVSVGCLAFAGSCAVAGTLTGLRQWSVYAGLITAESALRVVAVAVVAIWWADIVSLAAATVSATASWLLSSAVSKRARVAWSRRGDVRAQQFLARACSAMIATASSALLVSGFPVLLKVTSDGPLDAREGVLLAAVMVTRAPLMVPLYAYQGVAISHFLHHRDHPLRALVRPIGLFLALGLLGAGLAWLVGPSLFHLVFGPVGVSRGLVAALTGTASLLAVITLTGSAALAVDLHRGFVVGWLVAIATAVAFLALPVRVELRAVAALAAGPLAGALVHVAALRGSTSVARSLSRPVGDP